MNTNLSAQREEFSQKKKLLGSLRSELHSLHQQKEETFHKLRTLHDQIKQHNDQLKVLKENRDALTAKVKELKQQRDTFNQAVKERASEKKIVDDKKKELLEQLDYVDNPQRLKSEMRKLEEKIETEVMPFKKEQELQKKIKELKARYIKVAAVETVWKEANTSSANFSEARRKAQDFHHSMQQMAQQSQQKHEEVNKVFEEIKELRQQERPLADAHRSFKEKYESQRKETEGVAARVKELAALFEEEQEQNFKHQVKEKTAAVTEKLKKGKKLSMDDILAFQASKEE